ncbi:MAG: T9SS type A sorting domain-containing protein [Bacteroidia bacterium]
MKPTLILFVFFSLFCSVESVAQNSAPYALDPKSYQTLPGQTACLNIKTADDDPADTVRISWNTAVQTATFTHNSGFVKHAEGQICWTTTNSDPRPEPYLFFITMDDGHVQVVDTFFIWVRGIPERDSFHITKGDCGERIFYSSFNQWTDKVMYQLSNGMTAVYNMPVEEVSFTKLKPGMYVLRTQAASNTPVFNNYRDTFYVTEGQDVTSQFETLSEPNEYRITLTEHSGNPDVHYSWTLENSLGINMLPDTLMQLTVQVWEPSDLCVYISSDGNCADTLCFSLTADPNGIQELNRQSKIYPNPCIDQLHIESPKPILSLTLFDTQGKQVLHQEAAATLSTKLEVAVLPKGTYLLAIRYADQSVGRHAIVLH